MYVRMEKNKQTNTIDGWLDIFNVVFEFSIRV